MKTKETRKLYHDNYPRFFTINVLELTVCYRKDLPPYAIRKLGSFLEKTCRQIKCKLIYKSRLTILLKTNNKKISISKTVKIMSGDQQFADIFSFYAMMKKIMFLEKITLGSCWVSIHMIFLN